jgi:plastocyanin
VGSRVLVIAGALLVIACNGAEVHAVDDGQPGVAEASSAALAAPPPARGDLHFVRLVARVDSYAFEPDEVRIRPGDVVRFVNTGYQPESVAFDAGEATPEVRQFLQLHGLVAGPLLTGPGAFFDVSFENAPPGAYPFSSVPHRAQGMRGRVIVED